jgi:23S rRNA (uracil-5-)-methyltransferase RumA
MKIGDELEVTIGALARSGAGVVELDGATLSVEGAAPGDTVRIRVDARSRHRPLAHGSIVEVVERGAAFQRPVCHHAAPLRGKCGGCPTQHITRDAALEAKRSLAAASLSGLAPVEKIRAGREALGVRNRGNFLLWRAPAGEIRFGSRQARTGAMARMDGCPMLQWPLIGVVERTMEALTRVDAPVAPEPGGVHGLSVRVSPDGKCLVELVTLPEPGDWLSEVAAHVAMAPSVVGVVRSTHDGAGNAIRQSAPVRVTGADTIQVELAGVRLALTSDAFFQLNFDVAAQVFDDVSRRVGQLAATRDGAVWDLYAGAGVAGIAAAREAGRPLRGAEAVRAAVDTAARASRGMDAAFEVVDLEAPLGEALRSWPSPAVVLVDPPRRGMSEAVRTHLAAVGAPVVAMSCDPETFARDARFFVERGWRVDDVIAWDMLPMTPHVELTATLLPPSS